jgi:aspartyl-tRNA synthetase
VDRLAAILAGEENIREVIAYPKTQSGADPLTGAPTPLPSTSLAELGIRVVAPATEGSSHASPLGGGMQQAASDDKGNP